LHVVLETERLDLRRLTLDDADALVELDGDPEVMRYLTNGRPTPREVIVEQLRSRFLPEYERFAGLGRWAAVERSSGAFLGWLALAPREPGSAELGYRLRRSAWGKGYATEGARALVHHAFAELGLERVWAQTMAVNLRSRRVMERAGLRFVRVFHESFDDPIPGAEHGEVEYAIMRSEWLGSGAGAT
jgi:RimJ/RimL family protein N-acetyltransferase